MAHDLLFGETQSNWSREPGITSSGQDQGPGALTDQEKKRLEQLAVLEMKATRGDVEAQKKIVQVNAALNDLSRKAAKGDAKAARILATLKDAGLVEQIAASSKRSAAKLTMAGEDDNSTEQPTIKNRQARLVQTIQKLLAQAAELKAAPEQPNPPIYMKTSYYDELVTSANKGNKWAKADLAIYDHFLQTGQLKKIRVGLETGQSMWIEMKQPIRSKDRALANTSGSFVGQNLAEMNGYHEILGGSSLNDDEATVAHDGGACERASLARLSGARSSWGNIAKGVARIKTQSSQKRQKNLTIIINHLKKWLASHPNHPQTAKAQSQLAAMQTRLSQLRAS